MLIMVFEHMHFPKCKQTDLCMRMFKHCMWFVVVIVRDSYFLLLKMLVLTEVSVSPVYGPCIGLYALYSHPNL